MDNTVKTAQELVLSRAQAVERIGDEGIYLEIAHYFAGHLIASLADLRQALNEGDTESAARLTHSLKGNCAMVGAEAMREHCLCLEKLCRADDLDAAREQYALMNPKMLALQRVLAALF
ncbi:MAG: Hpt domain-containing protein [Desulfovibrionaceae bacterium]|nr:Hpt domain-containing protein [Desulfovibrionaceae bacterium]